MRQIVVFGAVSLPSDARTHESAQWYAYGANRKHGLPRTNEDKRLAVEAALKHPRAASLSTRDLAKHCGVSRMAVQRAKDSICHIVTDDGERTVTRNGTTYPMNTAKIGKRSMPQADALDLFRQDITTTPQPKPGRPYR